MGACLTIENDLHPLTLKLIDSGIQFDSQNNGQLGFGTYAVSPEAKSFAASVNKTGQLGASFGGKG